MAVGFPAKTNFATGDVLTATNVNDITGTLNLLQSTLYPAGRNKVINGKFDIWQRGAGTFSADGASADRWVLALSGATAGVTRQSFTVGQTDVPNNPDYFLRLAVTTGDNSCRIETRIEDVTESSSETFTISFYAKGTNPAGGSLDVIGRQEFGSGGSAGVIVTAGSIVLTTSWQKFSKTFTYASVAGKTIGAGNWYGIDIRQPISDTGTAAWTLDISNVQLENGSTASPFQTASGSIGGELALCQRYYYRSIAGTTTGDFAQGQVTSVTNVNCVLQLPVTMRTATATIDYPAMSNFVISDATSAANPTSITLNQATTDNVSLSVVYLSFTVGRIGRLYANGTTSAYIGVSAEL